MHAFELVTDSNSTSHQVRNVPLPDASVRQRGYSTSCFPIRGGLRPADFETTLKFRIALTRLAAEDPAVHKLTVEVQHLLRPRSVYRDPALVQRVLAKMAEA
jgi:hypothetical protein